MVTFKLFPGVASLLACSLAAAACGGRVGEVDGPTPSPSSETAPGAGTTAAAPSANAPPAPSASIDAPPALPSNTPISVDPQASNGAPRVVEVPDPPPNVAVPFHLVVSNQSFVVATADIDVKIDGRRVVTGDFEVGSQHSYMTFDFALHVGTHRLEAVSKRGGVAFAGSFDVPAERWAVLTYWQDRSTPPQFELHTMSSAPGFD